LANQVHGPGDVAAPISSGSFRTDGMIIAPCSMKTLAAVRTGYGEGLIPRAADVTLKERRLLVLVPRELPLSEIHLENMLALSRMGAVIAPPVPAFYTRPETVEEIVTHIAARVLDQFGLELPGVPRWSGPEHGSAHRKEANSATIDANNQSAFSTLGLGSTHTSVIPTAAGCGPTVPRRGGSHPVSGDANARSQERTRSGRCPEGNIGDASPSEGNRLCSSDNNRLRTH
jgi:polyprenyl P-hydroxybenzoate/phenylacrylic acid decarboxylase-like protein